MALLARFVSLVCAGQTLDCRVFIQMAEPAPLFLMIFVNVKWTGWTIEMSRHGKSSDIFLNWKWPEKLEENKVNVNLTKIVNDYENIPTSDTSSNMLYIYIGYNILIVQMSSVQYCFQVRFWYLRCWLLVWGVWAPSLVFTRKGQQFPIPYYKVRA